MSAQSCALKPAAETLPAADAPGFKEVLSRLASGLAVVACWDADGEPQGLLLSSITGLSVDPPRFLFCVRKAASAHPALAAAEACSVSLLSASQRAEAERFGRSDLARRRFEGPGWLFEDLAPRLVGGLASVVGRIEQRFDAGEHEVFVFAAEALEQGGGEPLIYVDRGFAAPAAL